MSTHRARAVVRLEATLGPFRRRRSDHAASTGHQDGVCGGSPKGGRTRLQRAKKAMLCAQHRSLNVRPCSRARNLQRRRPMSPNARVPSIQKHPACNDSQKDSQKHEPVTRPRMKRGNEAETNNSAVHVPRFEIRRSLFLGKRRHGLAVDVLFRVIADGRVDPRLGPAPRRLLPLRRLPRRLAAAAARVGARYRL